MSTRRQLVLPGNRAATHCSEMPSRITAVLRPGTGSRASVDLPLQNLWTLTGGVWRHRLVRQNPEAWREAERGFANEIAHAWDAMLELIAEKNVGTLLDLGSLPQLVCVGFPLLEHQRPRARALWLQARETAAAGGYQAPDLHPGMKRAHANYARWAEIRLACGILVADGLRTANYRDGRLGRHHRFTPRLGASGALCGLKALTSRWAGLRTLDLRDQRVRSLPRRP